MLIAEELLMIALDDEEGLEIEHGDLSERNTLSEGIDGAMQIELTLGGYLNLGPQGAVMLANDTPTGDAVLDEALAAIKRQQAAQSDQCRIGMLLDAPHLKTQMLDRLISTNVLRRVQHPLRQEPDRFLWVIPEGVDPRSETLPERVIRKRIHDVVLDMQPADERTRALICLVQACGLVQEVFPRHDLSTTHQRVEAVVNQSPVVSALYHALKEIRKQRSAT